MASVLMPAAELLTTAVVVSVGIAAWSLALLNVLESWRHEAARRRSRERPGSTMSRAPTDTEIEARVAHMVGAGLLPSGWLPRDASRLLRVHARRARLVY